MKRLLFIILVAVLIICGTGCNTYAMFHQYPRYRSDHWYCEELDLHWYFTYDDNGQYIPQNYQLTWDNVVYDDVTIGLQSCYLSIMCDVNRDGVIELEERLLEGNWEYCGENIVVEITLDNLLNGAYTQLVFIPLS